MNIDHTSIKMHTILQNVQSKPTLNLIPKPTTHVFFNFCLFNYCFIKFVKQSEVYDNCHTSEYVWIKHFSQMCILSQIMFNIHISHPKYASHPKYPSQLKYLSYPNQIKCTFQPNISQLPSYLK